MFQYFTELSQYGATYNDVTPNYITLLCTNKIQIHINFEIIIELIFCFSDFFLLGALAVLINP